MNGTAGPIRQMQTWLRQLARKDGRIPPVVPDGIFGPQTKAALTAFQKSRGLPAHGRSDSPTWHALRWEGEQALRREQPVPLRLDVPGDPQGSPALLHLLMEEVARPFGPLYPPGEREGDRIGRLQTLFGQPATGRADRDFWEALTALWELLAQRGGAGMGGGRP